MIARALHQSGSRKALSRRDSAFPMLAYELGQGDLAADKKLHEI
jgi:hypothetical protein